MYNLTNCHLMMAVCFDVAVVCDVTTLDADVAATEFACGGEIVGC